MAASIFLAKPFTTVLHTHYPPPLSSIHLHSTPHKWMISDGSTSRLLLHRFHNKPHIRNPVLMAIDDAPAAAPPTMLHGVHQLVPPQQQQETTALVTTVKLRSRRLTGEGRVVLQLVSKQVDPKTMKSKLSQEAVLNWKKSHKIGAQGGGDHTFQVNLLIDSDFGIPGAVCVRNEYPQEFFLERITIEGAEYGFACKSWVQPAAKSGGTETRVFFIDKAYLPSQTPAGLAELRQKELKDLQGDGKGLRLPSDRIYDYDVYNDLGNPDKGTDLARTTLGGESNPYPRRCRTGRPAPATDEMAEAPTQSSYVPRDEEYEDQKRKFMSQGKRKAVLRNIIPIMIAKVFGEDKFYLAVDSDNQSGGSKTNMKVVSLDKLLNGNLFLKLLRSIHETIERVLELDPPKYISKNVVWGLPDEEFGRRVLTGTNPVNIEKLKVFPPVSKLDPSIYGSRESTLKDEHIISFLEGMSVQQALSEDKLYILDYHDIFLPYVDRVNAIEGRKMYATRTVFFLTPLGTLKPVAIELSLPEGNPSSKVVLTPPPDGTINWLWELGKEHVCSNDAAVHTLVNHWLRIHACMEPFFIALHRNLSVMHPVFKLLHPHTRYLLKTNAFSRDVLINAGAFIESFNAPAKYCMQFSASAYLDWRFDLEGLPEDLIRRGMSSPDSTQPHGLKLAIEDYPYAQDGLLIWSAIENLVTEYVNYYYPEANHVKSDTELQAWYNESIKTGHADVGNATWWPKLSTPKDLINILATIIWKVSGQHAVHNFGQYSYGAYVPARPPFMRKLLPSENDSTDYQLFMENPQEYFLSSIPSFTQATRYAAVLDTGSSHSPDEEYLGERKDLSSWAGEPEILEAYHKFSMDMKCIEQEINRRNSDPSLRNRCGAGTFPFELLIPSSGSGTTSRGIPNSVTA